ncbi:coagulation factor 5/8 type domain-containing protein [Pseudoxanthomonas winnipegensis]|uniref:Coagulation factor 5/8 type domain-containing protein n=2 Tax=Pseudoxanthomonas winnipegensis TaxID=2480810 RepID=A0A4Q8LI94_9GAMM|nr:coagulation factor 5/8 type domain-containing protein [Pseudoxanthomonas winnipegensis]TAA29639.1 coagulation factor 5/8 type domain-containing protein [Pseudoxanthomonas winnipegensis]TAA40474.1 coagulation factor 5/8 type domain-containing protein [Pseudoxanthomonas winnipegensis]TBV76502.1 coagulation factor 5/8 type domain-containing protein [Pseudoxanthomonas winnipegensis]
MNVIDMSRCRSLVAFLIALGLPASAQAQTRVLDAFDDPSTWKVVTSNQVTASLRTVPGADGGKALCLDYDYHGVSGYAGLQRQVALDYPDNYRFDFQLRGASPANDLQFKLTDASGDNVWWVNRPAYDFPGEWTPVTYRKRQIDKAWGPDPDKTLRHSAKLEYTIYNNAGGKGSVCFDALTFTALPPQDTRPLTGSASASTANGGSSAALAVDGNPDTAWYADFDAATPPQLTLDLHSVREFGGLKLVWKPGEQASDYLVQLSDDGVQWRDARAVVDGDGGTDWIALPETEARYVRVLPAEGPHNSFGLAELQVLPLAFSATPNEVIKTIAATSPKGWYPRGFSGQQPYWTIIGLDGGTEQGLIGEDGAVEVARGGFSVEPFVVTDGRLVSWADVKAQQSLQDGYLPIPSVEWRHPALALTTTAFADGTPADSQLVVRYTLRNPDSRAHAYRLALALRPFQVNPPTQFLSVPGGVSRIESIAFDGRTARVNGAPRVYASQAPDAAFATSFDGGMAVSHLLDDTVPAQAEVVDETGLASGAYVYELTLEPGQSRQFDLRVPMTGKPRCSSSVTAADCGAQARQDAVAALWRDKLDRVRFTVPAAGQPLVDTLRTATAHMLISRVGPRLQPGTRSYNRSWIRDGAMISEGLLRMGRPQVVRDYIAWYAPFQFKDGMVPCCVDRRGSDPVPENDSHGELIFAIADYWRYTGDTAFVQRMWPHVEGAYRYMEQLRLSERTEQNRAKDPAFYGMMPVSISHEGYSAKPVHSYWDNFWALRGYKDAVELAQVLGKTEDAKRMAASRDQFRADLMASLQAAAREHGIDFLPGSAELGDFDSTSTTIALAPGGEQGQLPQPLLDNTFQRYWTEFEQRADGQRAWKDYTPYEWRNVAAFVRLGWRTRANRAVDFFFAHRTPQPWNQWAEVVSHTPRVPFFLGDLPHAWVASDFVRTALDMFAYTRELDDSLVLAAGIPPAWLDEQGIAIAGLRTPEGPLSYTLRHADGQLQLDVPAGLKLPKGGLVLPWPYAGTPGQATIDGKPAQWQGGALRITRLPATVRIAAP